jgi:transposase
MPLTLAVLERDVIKMSRARHGCEVVREPRGLVRCPYGHTMHADLNAAMNILKRGGGKVPERVKVLSFTPTPGGVIERRKKRKKQSR